MTPTVANRSGVAAGMVGAAIVALAVFWLTARFGSAMPIILRSAGNMLALSLLGMPLAFTIAQLAAHRFRHTDDIDAAAGGPPSPRARQLQAMLQNTLEQTVLLGVAFSAATAATFGARTGSPDRCVAVALFLVGRILFFATYSRGAAARSFGFALGFYPTLYLLGATFGDAFR